MLVGAVDGCLLVDATVEAGVDWGEECGVCELDVLAVAGPAVVKPGELTSFGEPCLAMRARLVSGLELGSPVRFVL